MDDGLVGYFVSAPNRPGNTTFYAPAADVGGTGFVKQPTRTMLRAHAGGGGGPLLLTMLVDPRAPVHASTGILPVKAIDIPPDMYADALGNLAVTFQVAPVMSPASGVELPLPTEAGFTWSWLSTSLTGWSEGALATPNLKAVFSDPPQQLHEGWLKLARAPVRPPAGKVPSATNFVLGKEPGPMTDLIAGAAPAGLQFAVQNAQGRPVVYLGGQAGQNDLRVTMSNLTGGSLALRGGAAVAEPPGASGPTSFYLTFDFLDADQLALTAVSAAGWLAVRQAGPPQCWALTPAQDLTLGAGEPVELTVTGISPSGRPRPGTVAVDFYNVPGLSDDTWEATVLVQNPPNDQKALQLTPEMDSSVVFISVDADHTVRNELTWSLSNPQPDAPLVADDTPWGAQPPMFTVSFVYSGPPGYGALTTADRAAQVQLSPGEPYADNWVVTPQQQGPKTYWTLEPANHEVLGAGASATVEFKFTDIVTFLRPGLTQMYVQYANIPGYADGYRSFSLRKVVPMTITSLEVEPAWAEAATLPQAVSLSWALQGDGWVELQSTDGLDMANPANPYPVPAVAHPVRFTLRATPKEQGPPAVAQTTFNVVTFTPNQAPVWLWRRRTPGGAPPPVSSFPPGGTRCT